MATFNSRLVRCSLCTKVYQDPRILPCSDTFCKGCLQESINKGSGSLKSFPCPKCKKTTAVDKLNLQQNRWAETFPVNKLIMSILERYSFSNIEKPEHYKQNMKCIRCSEEDKESDAAFFCITCDEYLCKECCIVHNKFKETRNHPGIAIEELPKDISMIKTMNKMCQCTAHPERKVEYKCYEQACDTLLCSICAAMEHRQHNIARIDKMDSTVTRTALTTVKGEARLLQSSAQSKMDKVLSDAEQLENSIAKMKHSTSVRFEKLLSSITQFQKDVAVKLSMPTEKEVITCANSISDYVGIIRQLKMLNDTIDIVLRSGSMQQVLVLIREIQKENKLINEKINCKKEQILDLDQNVRIVSQKMEYINTILDTLLDISEKLFKTLNENKDSKNPSGLNQAVAIYASEENRQNEKTVCKLVFRQTNMKCESILVAPIEEKLYSDRCAQTDTVFKRNKGVDTEPLHKVDTSQQTYDIAQCNKHINYHLLQQDESVQTLNEFNNVSYREIEEEIFIFILSFILLFIGFTVWLKIGYDTLTGNVPT